MGLEPRVRPKGLRVAMRGHKRAKYERVATTKNLQDQLFKYSMAIQIAADCQHPVSCHCQDAGAIEYSVGKHSPTVLSLSFCVEEKSAVSRIVQCSNPATLSFSYIHTHTLTRHIQTHRHTDRHTHTHKYTYTHTHTLTHTLRQTHTNAHIHTHTCTRTHTQTHKDVNFICLTYHNQRLGA